jgi:uncharacterized protein YfaS (alpha-2-macroglobulin family)
MDSGADASHDQQGTRLSLRAVWLLKTVGFGVALLMLGGVAWLLQQQSEPVQPVKEFSKVYSLVPEKLSQSAAIPVSLPAGVTEAEAKQAISFTPEVSGGWAPDEDPDDGLLRFVPNEALALNRYYAVHLDAEGAQMSGDFLVEEDPRVEAVFPAEGTETHEDTEITIVFNRPMVPLTTLEVQESLPLPITISPETPGTFKWISTRSVQFQPASTLIPSSEYAVRIGDGLTSVDGLPVAPLTHTFDTRALRIERITEPGGSFQRPLVIHFNQAVDLEATANAVSLKTQDGRDMPFEYRYAEGRIYDNERDRWVTYENMNAIEIRQRRDTHGRTGLWDFETNYTFSIRSAEPLFGTNPMRQGQHRSFAINNVIAATEAESDSTRLARPDFFDPAGKLKVTFYEEVDKDRSRIEVPHLQSVEYGETCRRDEAGEVVRIGNSCEMVPDRTVLVFDFDESRIGRSEQIDLQFERMVTPEGLIINPTPLTINLVTYPVFRINEVKPPGGLGSASLQRLVVCSNSPLQAPGDAGMGSYLQANDYMVFGRWSDSYYRGETSRLEADSCAPGQFQTNLNYGLLPQQSYSITYSFTDAFGQASAPGSVNFTTQAAESRNARFHNLQKEYNVTVPERTTLTYAVENIEYLDMRICELTPEAFLELTVDRGNRTAVATDCIGVATERIELPRRYWVNNYFQVDVSEYFSDPRGHYQITFQNPLLRSAGQREFTYVSVTDLAVGKKEVQFEEGVGRGEAVRDRVLDLTPNLYWVTRAGDLSAVTGATVSQYSKQQDDLVSSGVAVTDQQGLAEVGRAEDIVGAVVRSGADSAVVTNWSDTLNYASRARPTYRTYTYTDRPIYRPGDTVHIRGIDRIGFDGEYEVWPGETTELSIRDARGSELHSTEVAVSEYGTFNTDFTLPIDAPLGYYQIRVLDSYYSFRVEEYVPAAFKLEAETNQEEYVNGDTLELEALAEYYFGAPVSGGTLKYRITAQDYYFDRYTDEYFQFGSGWYYCYSCGFGDSFLVSGEVAIDDNGRARIEQGLDFETLFDDPDSEQSKVIVVNLTAQDVNGRSVSAAESFILHKGEFYLGINRDRYYTDVETPLTLKAKTVDRDGQPLRVRDVDLIVNRITWDTFRRREVDGGFYYRSERRTEEVSRQRINTDSNGDWSSQQGFTESGQYEIVVESRDERGNLIQSKTAVYVAGAGRIYVPPNNNYDLDMEIEVGELSVGDTATILIKSPYERAKALITTERGQIYDQWVVDITDGVYVHEFTVTEQYAPNVFVSAILVSDVSEVKSSNVGLRVESDAHELTIEATPRKEEYLPGEAVTIDVLTTDRTGNGVPAELSLAVVDMSVLALVGNPKKDPHQFFYNGFPLSVTTASNLKHLLYEQDIPLGTKGGGGASPDDLAQKRRGEFRDTAHWTATVRTGADGRGEVTFTLPDNLTTWQVEAVGVTQDTKVGVGYDEFTSRKQVMASPLRPRFIVPGDEFSIGATIFNQTDATQRITVNASSESLLFQEGSETAFTLEPGESRPAYFPVVAPTAVEYGSHEFVIRAETAGYVDEVEQIIPITPNETYETVATAGYTTEPFASEYLYLPDNVLPGKGQLTVNANGTLAVFMADALEYMLRYPYGCSEQKASALATIAVLTEALDLPNVPGEVRTIEYRGERYDIEAVVADSLREIYENQAADGGFRYYQGLRPSLYLTIHVHEALYRLAEAGYEVRSDVLDRARSYIERETVRALQESEGRNYGLAIAAEYALRQRDPDRPTTIASYVNRIIADEAYLVEDISSISLAKLAIIAAEGYSDRQAERVYEALTNRMVIDGRGAYLEDPGTSWRQFYGTPVRNTAYLVQAFVAHDDENVTMGNVLRWLLASRDQRGVWGGTHNTYAVVDALTAYLQWRRETESNFTVRGFLGEEERFSHEFTPENIMELFRHEVTIDELPRNQLTSFVLEREPHNGLPNTLYYDMSLRYYLPVQSLPIRDEGITIERNLYSLQDEDESTPVFSAKQGEVIKGTLTLTVPKHYEHVIVEDIIPAGFELVNLTLATEDATLRSVGVNTRPDSGFRWSDLWRSQSALVLPQDDPLWFGGVKRSLQARELRPSFRELHDDRVFLYAETLQPGVYEYQYLLRAQTPGTFQHLPARAEEMYFPEIFGRTSGSIVTVTRGD